MGVQNFTCVDGDTTTNATFRAWGLAISTALQALGTLTKTADTGQINWATVLTPSGASQSMGYEMYALTDALQATAPVFIKIEYGSGTGASRPGMWVTIGTGTDGAGNLTSMAGTGVSVSTRQSFILTGTVLGLQKPCVVNGDASSLLLMLWNGTDHTGFFLVERVRNPDGTPSGDAVTVMSTSQPGGTGVVPWQSVFFHTQVPQPLQNTSQGLAMVPPPATSGIKDSVMATYPVCTGVGPRLGAPSKFMIAHVAADLSGLATFSCTHYGAAHNWVSLSNPRSPFASGFGGSPPNTALAVRTD